MVVSRYDAEHSAHLCQRVKLSRIDRRRTGKLSEISRSLFVERLLIFFAVIRFGAVRIFNKQIVSLRHDYVLKSNRIDGMSHARSQGSVSRCYPIKLILMDVIIIASVVCVRINHPEVECRVRSVRRLNR